MERMRRTQIYLDASLDEAIERLARARRTSKASLIRLAARRFVEQQEAEEEDPILGLIGLGNAGPGQVSEEHDRVLTERLLDGNSR